MDEPTYTVVKWPTEPFDVGEMEPYVFTVPSDGVVEVWYLLSSGSAAAVHVDAATGELSFLRGA